MEVKIVGIRFRKTGKVYNFDPKNITFKIGDGVICETDRGIEFGRVALPNRLIEESKLPAPVKPIMRKATEKDLAAHEKNLADKERIIEKTKELIQKNKLDMELIDGGYTFDRQKIVIYFTAPGKVDFRQLVKDLASELKSRIELRQIYEKNNDVQILGSYGQCGRPCCCTLYGVPDGKVTNKMLKQQGLAYNQQKLSGPCGKMLCCLRYESAYYAETSAIMPKVGTIIKTPDGEGKVIDNSALKRTVEVLFETTDSSQTKLYTFEELGLENIKVETQEDNSQDSNDDLPIDDGNED